MTPLIQLGPGGDYVTEYTPGLPVDDAALWRRWEPWVQAALTAWWVLLGVVIGRML